MQSKLLPQKQTCYLSHELNIVLGTSKILFHNDTVIKLEFEELGKAQKVIPHLKSRIKLLTLKDWVAKETRTKYSLRTIQKKLEFKGIHPIEVEIFPDGTYNLAP